ncbi:MAG: universal stress protein [Polaromonas sp.]|uniref:universal stress protein n=1 Tax=Polaromonas sp. TaxID=1869339 RepID=UPI002734C393|nr:universal stress protein [Polaromonas sp.]MDP2819625.1 universal stress protein [Polaromonas sp.]
MKILFAADGSTFTKKALTFIVNNKSLLAAGDELLVLHVQDAISAQIERKLGAAEVAAYQTKQADAVLKPIKKFLDKHAVNYRCVLVIGAAAHQIIETSKRERVKMIVMGAHGHGLLSRMFMGSVAQRVLAESEIPTLLVK